MPSETNEEFKPKDLEIFEDVLSNSPFGINNLRTYEAKKRVVFFSEKFIDTCRWSTARLENYTYANFFGIWLARVHKYRLFFAKCDFTTRYPRDDGERLENYKWYWDYSLFCTQDRILREFLDVHSPDDFIVHYYFMSGLNQCLRRDLAELRLNNQESQLGDIDYHVTRYSELIWQSIERKKSNRENLPTLEGVASSTFWHDPDNIPDSYRHQKVAEEAIDNEYIPAKKEKLGIV